ncbi:ETC complex I subunit [Magnetospirillum aberrantis]|uniref:ETC complex I subunit n=1 Tax=Magnetospirillum aberrantis SpK TaxID=908842 RepID=A0A7C9UYW7_9PROT|nr:ETC complex I subunit [Magnetospirillum aberrantis]NFV80215.1 ETC complex I subunit [Magnetospirillum aberrantis SpK]
MQVRIYRPAQTTMQSGKGNSQAWVLEYEPIDAKKADPLMGWLGSSDMTQQIRLKFASKEEAVAYATRKGLEFEVIEPATKKPVPPKNYSDNFRFDKLEFGRF